MTTANDQKQQTQQYFDTHAGDWHSLAVGQTDRYNVIAGRNGAVLRAIETMAGVNRFLDIGCGTGQLVIEVAGKGIKAAGIDFAPDMIRQCEVNRQGAGVEAEFSCLSFFDMPAQSASYDVISAQGFIEYISPEETERFLSRSFSLLREGGALVVGSRNRLFNLLSFNDYTLTELQLGTVDQLAAEAIALHQSTSLQQAFEALRQHERKLPQPDCHPHTGIGVELRYQYSPAELICRGREAGFTPRNLFPVHFHGIPNALKNEQPRVHAELANLVGRLAPVDFRLVPYCSTFVLEFGKGE
jgi:2-polyprenyl-3-methyl-5-hydroxy-6-metoxy-1,4-benzoquinol methylase